MEKDQRVTFSGAVEKLKKRPICRAGFIAKSYQIFFSNTSKNSSEENILTPLALKLQRSPPLFIFFLGDGACYRLPSPSPWLIKRVLYKLFSFDGGGLENGELLSSLLETKIFHP